MQSGKKSSNYFVSCDICFKVCLLGFFFSLIKVLHKDSKLKHRFQTLFTGSTQGYFNKNSNFYKYAIIIECYKQHSRNLNKPQVSMTDDFLAGRPQRYLLSMFSDYNLLISVLLQYVVVLQREMLRASELCFIRASTGACIINYMLYKV